MTPPATPAGNGNARFEDLRETVIQHDKRIAASENASAAMTVEVAHIRATVERIDARTSGEAIGKAIHMLVEIAIAVVILWGIFRGPQPVQQVAPTAITAPAAASTPHHAH